MRVKCIRELPTKEQAVQLGSYYAAGKQAFHVHVGKEYLVYGITFLSGCPWVELKEDFGYLHRAPLGLFEITDGRVSSCTASIPGASSLSGTTGYTYDTKDQITQETSTRNGGFTDNFAYDSAGNPTTFKGVTKTYNSDNQQTGAGFSHDGNGNPTTYSGTTLTFDPENRMTVYGSVLTAGYNGDGLRAWKQHSTGRTYFLYDGNVPVVEIDSSGSVTATTTFGANGLVSRQASSASAFYSFDSEGNVSQRSDVSGGVLSNYLFAAHGSVLSGTLNEPFGYRAQVGYYTDNETGLQLLTNRYYDPTSGRFLTRDPISYTGGINLYAYVTNGPIGYADPSGLKTGSDWYDTWEKGADIRKAPKFWQDLHDESIQNGDWVTATGADVMNGLIEGAELPNIQADGEILGSDASFGRKALAAGDLVRIYASWYYCLSGEEFVPTDPKKLRIAPAGNRNWRPGWKPPEINQLPHYHMKRPGPGGSYKWHRPWEKGF